MASKPSTITVTCPKCGHRQAEPKEAYSSICKKCRAHFRLQEAIKPVVKAKKPAVELKTIRCFQCGTDLEVPVAAESTMCKRCSSHVDLQNYQITQTVSKNFRTYGRLVLEEKGYILNTDSLVGEAVLKGRLIGKLVTTRTLEIYSTAQIKGRFQAGCLVVPAGEHFRWPEPVQAGGADIAGELTAELRATGTVTLRATARLFGNVQATGLVVESGAVIVGAVKVTPEPPASAPSAPSTANSK